MSISRKTGMTGIAAALALTLVGAAWAQGAPERRDHDDDKDRPHMMWRDADHGPSRFAMRQLELLDTNGDGTISREEIAAEHQRLLGAADVDGDGQLSPDEFRRRGALFLRLGTTTFFDLIDTNGDQKISVEELNQPMARWFARRDTNGDGKIDIQEFDQDRGSFGPRHR